MRCFGHECHIYFRLLLYDLDVTSFGMSNTYGFKFNERRIVLKHAQLKPSVKSHKTVMVTIQVNKKPLHLAKGVWFLKKSKKEGIIYSIVAHESLLVHL